MIYLDAIQSNYQHLRSQLPEECVFYAVLKSDAYGHGITEVSNALTGAGCQHFAVGNLLEAIQIRKQGIEGEILLLNPIPSWAAETAVSNDLGVHETRGFKPETWWQQQKNQKKSGEKKPGQKK